MERPDLPSFMSASLLDGRLAAKAATNEPSSSGDSSSSGSSSPSKRAGGPHHHATMSAAQSDSVSAAMDLHAPERRLVAREGIDPFDMGGEPGPAHDGGHEHDGDGGEPIARDMESDEQMQLDYLTGPSFNDDNSFTPEGSPGDLLEQLPVNLPDSTPISAASTPGDELDGENYTAARHRRRTGSVGEDGQDDSDDSDGSDDTEREEAPPARQPPLADKGLRKLQQAGTLGELPQQRPAGPTPFAGPAARLRSSFSLDSTPSRPRPRAMTLSHSAFGSYGTFPSTARAGPLPEPTLRSRVRLLARQTFAFFASAGFLVLIVCWALVARAVAAAWHRVFVDPFGSKDRAALQSKLGRAWDDPQRWRDERCVKDIRYYARACGFDVEEHIVETKDGYLLKVYKVVCVKDGFHETVHADGKAGFPVLIMHGLFQSCGSFVTSEERSLAFWLAERGYQVFLGNNRGVFDSGHVRLSRSDPRFWDFNIKELALYDLPAMVDHVRIETGYDKIAYIGHSQGNATMFCSLAQGMVPELGERLSIFVALAPAVYAGPLTTGFPFGYLKSMKWKTWRKWFGVLDFIPLMRISYDWCPSYPFGLLGYQMFAFLFNWTDLNWLPRRKAKKFRFTPSPVSSASIFWWTGYNGFSTRGCVLDPHVNKWYDRRFPPLSLHHGERDYLVLIDPLLERLKTHETDVEVLTVKEMRNGEHCDFFWHLDAVELCYESIVQDIEKTRPRFPEEQEGFQQWSSPSKQAGSSGAATTNGMISPRKKRPNAVGPSPRQRRQGSLQKISE